MTTGSRTSAMRDSQAYLKPEDISRSIEVEPMFRNKLLIRLLFRSGVRVSELVGLETSNVLYNENCIIIPWLKRRYKEGEKQPVRKVPIDPETMEWIHQWLMEKRMKNNQGKYVFGIGRKEMYVIVRRSFERIGIKHVGSEGKWHHPHPHTLRHSYATLRVKNTRGDYSKMRKVQLDMGHADISTTASYLDMDPEELHKGYDEDFEGVK